MHADVGVRGLVRERQCWPPLLRNGNTPAFQLVVQLADLFQKLGVGLLEGSEGVQGAVGSGFDDAKAKVDGEDWTVWDFHGVVVVFHAAVEFLDVAVR